MLHMIAYLGVCMFDKCGSGFTIHLVLSEWKEFVYPLLRISMKKNRSKPSQHLMLLAVTDGVFCFVFTCLLWLFALHVLLSETIPIIFKVAIAAYGIILGIWLKGRLKLTQGILTEQKVKARKR